MVSWILLATPAQAIIFSHKHNQFDIIKKFSNEEVRKKQLDIYSDRPGVTKASWDQDMAPLENRHYFEEIDHKFADEIMSFIDRSRHLGKIKSLLIVTTKPFAGYIRKNISVSLEEIIDGEILKNFYTEKEHELKEFLAEHQYQKSA